MRLKLAMATAAAALYRRLCLWPGSASISVSGCLWRAPCPLHALAPGRVAVAGFVYATIEFTASLNLCLSFRFLQCHSHFPCFLFPSLFLCLYAALPFLLWAAHKLCENCFVVSMNAQSWCHLIGQLASCGAGEQGKRRQSGSGRQRMP